MSMSLGENSGSEIPKAEINVTPLADNFADGAYRLQLGRVMLKRALADALEPPGAS